MCIHEEVFVNVASQAPPPKKKQAMYYNRIIEAPSRNHRCREEAMSIPYSQCVLCSLSCPAHKAHASYDNCHLLACPDLLYFSTISYKRHDFWEKKFIEHKMCVLFFSTTFV